MDALQDNGFRTDVRPWGTMHGLHAPLQDVTIKHIIILAGARTSLQYHERKDELLVIIEDYSSGYVEIGEGDDAELHHLGVESRLVRIPAGTRHRVVGPMDYLEVSTFDDDTDTVRVADDYGRAS